MTVEDPAVVFEWAWRFLVVLFLPAMIYIVKALRDVELNMAALTGRQDRIEERQTRTETDVQGLHREFDEHVAWGQERSNQITEQLATLLAAVQEQTRQLGILMEHRVKQGPE